MSGLAFWNAIGVKPFELMEPWFAEIKLKRRHRVVIREVEARIFRLL